MSAYKPGYLTISRPWFRLVAYCSDQAHSSVEKAGLIGLVKIRYIESDENLSLRGDKLKEAIKFDREAGLIPFFVSISLLGCDFPSGYQ